MRVTSTDSRRRQRTAWGPANPSPTSTTWWRRLSSVVRTPCVVTAPISAMTDQYHRTASRTGAGTYRWSGDTLNPSASATARVVSVTAANIVPVANAMQANWIDLRPLHPSYVVSTDTEAMPDPYSPVLAWRFVATRRRPQEANRPPCIRERLSTRPGILIARKVWAAHQSLGVRRPGPRSGRACRGDGRAARGCRRTPPARAGRPHRPPAGSPGRRSGRRSRPAATGSASR